MLMGSRQTLALLAMLACLDGSGCADGEGILRPPPESDGSCPAVRQYPYEGCELPLDCDQDVCVTYEDLTSPENCATGSYLGEVTCEGFRAIDQNFVTWFFREDGGEPVGFRLTDDTPQCCRRFGMDEQGCSVCADEGFTVLFGDSGCDLSQVAPVCFGVTDPMNCGAFTKTCRVQPGTNPTTGDGTCVDRRCIDSFAQCFTEDDGFSTCEDACNFIGEHCVQRGCGGRTKQVWASSPGATACGEIADDEPTTACAEPLVWNEQMATARCCCTD